MLLVARQGIHSCKLLVTWHGTHSCMLLVTRQGTSSCMLLVTWHGTHYCMLQVTSQETHTCYYVYNMSFSITRTILNLILERHPCPIYRNSNMTVLGKRQTPNTVELLTYSLRFLAATTR
jgi:hypothetical protein